MRRIFWLLAVLAAVIATGCSRQPQPHVGEWDAQAYSEAKQFQGNGSFYFSEDGTLQVIQGSSSPPIVWDGKYRFDYSKDPITLDIEWNKGQSLVPLYGIVQFVGEGKQKMRFKYSTKSRPSSFQANEPFTWLTKKVKQ